MAERGEQNDHVLNFVCSGTNKLCCGTAGELTPPEQKHDSSSNNKKPLERILPGENRRRLPKSRVKNVAVDSQPQSQTQFVAFEDECDGRPICMCNMPDDKYGICCGTAPELTLSEQKSEMSPKPRKKFEKTISSHRAGFPTKTRVKNSSPSSIDSTYYMQNNDDEICSSNISDDKVVWCSTADELTFSEHKAESSPRQSKKVDKTNLDGCQNSKSTAKYSSHLEEGICQCNMTDNLDISSSLSSLSDSDHDLSDEWDAMLKIDDTIGSSDTDLYYCGSINHSDQDDDDVYRTFDSDSSQDSSDFEAFEPKELPFPHRALHYMECEVCISKAYLRRRVCCDFQICDKCIRTYITMKVKEAKVQIECPNDRCDSLIYRDEILQRLSVPMKEKFAKFLIDANADPHVKTCPSCSSAYEIEPSLLKVSKRKLKQGVKVVCPKCKLQWCFPCQAPFHTGVSCKQFRSDHGMVKTWAKAKDNNGQTNAMKCPKCKIFIQKATGCNHIKCTQCNTNFCYRCGDRYIRIKFLGNHWSRLSLFGCKYRFLPHKPALRKFIRGTNFAVRLVAVMSLAGLAVAAGAVLVGCSVIFLPGYGMYRLRRHMKYVKRRQKLMEAVEAKRLKLKQRENVCSHLTTIIEESETEVADPQQVQVMVHRSVSFNREEAEETPVDFEVLVNRYTTDGCEIMVTVEKSGERNNQENSVATTTGVEEIPTQSGYTTVVANIVSSRSKTADKMECSDLSDEDILDTLCDGSGCSSDCGAHTLMTHQPCKSNKIKFAKTVSFSNNSEDDVGESTINIRNNDVLKKKTVFCCVNENHAQAQVNVDVSKRPTDSKADILKDCSSEKSDFQSKTVVENDGEDVKKVDEAKIVSKDIDESSSSVLKGKREQLKPNVQRGDPKEGNNGCFGNMFSTKRVTTPIISNSDIQSKPVSKKNLLFRKAATWEKCRSSNIGSVLMTSMESGDMKTLPLIMQRSHSAIASSDIHIKDNEENNVVIEKSDLLAYLENDPELWLQSIANAKDLQKSSQKPEDSLSKLSVQKLETSMSQEVPLDVDLEENTEAMTETLVTHL